MCWLWQHFSSRFSTLGESHIRSWEKAAERKRQQAADLIKPGGAGCRFLDAALMAEICRAIIAQVNAGVEVSAPLLRPFVIGIIIGRGRVRARVHVCICVCITAYEHKHVLSAC